MYISEVLLLLGEQIWFLIPLFLLITIFKSLWFKGKFGEFLVNRFLSSLPNSHYTLIKDITLPTEDGTTQIDHVVVSRFGIFVIETKNMKGWIFGFERQKQWTQKIYRHSSKFQNPLHQNYKHITTLESLLGCDGSQLHSVIVFVGYCTFKTQMPSNVTFGSGCIDYIRQFGEFVFSENEYKELIELLNRIKLKRGIVTDIRHRQHVKQLKESKTKTWCPQCGSDMVLRTAKRGDNKGQQFWGCSSYPKCRAIVSNTK